MTLPLRCGRTDRHHVETLIKRTGRVNSRAAGEEETPKLLRLASQNHKLTPAFFFASFYIIWLLEQQVGSWRRLMKAPIG